MRAWLLTWNIDNWEWQHFPILVQDTKAGKTVKEVWTCSNKTVEVGDRVYLMKVGNMPRGIVASGYATSKSFDELHYDPEKAAEGIMASRIEVEFDKILDYEKGELLLQDKLRELFPEQHWSPLASGIQIKEEYLKELEEQWQKTSESILSKKYKVYDAIWIATALLTYEKYQKQTVKNSAELAFRQTEIRDAASKICNDQIEAARTSQWTCGNHPNHSYCYLAELEGSMRRLAFPGEFGGKEEPADLSMEDVLSLAEGTITMQQLFDFVHNEYAALKEGALSITDINYIALLDYLKNSRGIPYKNPDSVGLSADERKKLLEIKKNGQDAVAIMKQIVALCQNKFGLNRCEPIQWLDGSNVKTRNYLWAQMKFDEYASRNESISVFVEMSETTAFASYRISLEIKNTGADKEMMKAYHRFLELPLNTQSGLVYVSGSNEFGRPVKLNEDQATVKEKVESGEYSKVQICRVIDRYPETTNVSIEKDILDAVNSLMPYYKHVLGLEDDEYTPKLSEYDPGLAAEQYAEVFRERKNITIGELDTLYYLWKMGGAGTCKQIAERFGKTYAHYNMNGWSAGKVVQQETGCPVYHREDGTPSYWPVVFVGRDAKQSEPGTFVWKLREPVAEAIRMLEEEGLFKDMIEKPISNKVNYDLNMILYGPPGTGKTYNTVIYAVAICDDLPYEQVAAEAEKNYDAVKARYDALVAEERIAFTTFHQSYDYEEFIEGIKPDIKDNDENDRVRYKNADGIFKKFCLEAEKKVIGSLPIEISEDAAIWKITLKDGTMNSVKERCFNDGTIRIGWGEKIDLTDANGLRCARALDNDMQEGDIIISFKDTHTIDGIAIVTDGGYFWDKDDPDGYCRARKVKWLAQNISENVYEMNGQRKLNRMAIHRVLHMSIADIIKIVKKHNTAFQTTTVEENDKRYVFIIDEINRGNISKIFGELITLIEDTKRKGKKEEARAILPYTGDEFGVPSNVYILGTMNTADRSIALMDTALRRRFQFIEKMPDASLLKDVTVTKDGKVVNVGEMLQVINDRIEFLFDREHTIGHAFFMGLKNTPEEDRLAKLGNIFRKSVVPLLQEYFYEDYEKIQQVLGDDGKKDTPEFKFIKEEERKPKSLFRSNTDYETTFTYVIQDSAFNEIESYIGIIG